MRLPCIHELDSRDGAANKDARLTNTLVGEKDNGEQVAELRPGLETAATSTGNAGGLVCFNSELVSVYGANLIAGDESLPEWVSSTPSSTGNWRSVSYGNGIFCAVKSSSSIASKSSDGISWVSSTMPSSGNWSSIEWDGSKFWAINSTDCTIATSTNGSNWSAISNPGFDTEVPSNKGIAINGSTVLAYQLGYTLGFITTNLGANWTEVTLPSGYTLASVASNGTIFCLVGNSDYAAISSNGIVWNEYVLPSTQTWGRVVWNGNVFCALAAGWLTDVVAVSSNGTSWNEYSLPQTNDWNAIGVDGSRIWVAASETTVSAFSDDDGESWTVVTISSADAWADIVSNEQNVVVCISGQTGVNFAYTKEVLVPLTAITAGHYDFAQSPI